MMNEFKAKGKELLDKIEELIKEGNVRRIIIKDEKDRVFMEVPVSVGVISAVCAPILTAVGALATMLVNFKVEVIRREEYDTQDAVIIEEEDHSTEQPSS